MDPGNVGEQVGALDDLGGLQVQPALLGGVDGAGALQRQKPVAQQPARVREDDVRLLEDPVGPAASAPGAERLEDVGRGGDFEDVADLQRLKLADCAERRSFGS